MDIGGVNKFFLYISFGEKAANMEYMYDLAEEIDVDVLKLAVKDAMECFPFFQLKPFIDKDGKICAEKNDGEVPVFKDDGKKVRLGTADTNGYLFRVIYSGKRITVVSSHGIGDGRGIGSFTQTVVYYYLTRQGINIDSEGLIYTKDDISDTTITDRLLDKVKTVQFTKPEPETNDQIAIFYPKNEMVYLRTADTKQFRLIWEQDKFIKVVKSFGGTPVVFTHALIAKTMKSFYGIEKHKYVANVPVDLRERLSSRAQSNFTTNVNINLADEDINLDMAEEMQLLRTRLKEATDLNKLLGNVVAFGEVLGYLDQIDLRNEDVLKGIAESNSTPTRSYLLSNIGLVKLPSGMVPHVKNVDIMFTTMEASPVFVMLTYENRGTLIIGQNYCDDGFAQALCKTFADYGISTELKDCGLVRSDIVNVSAFDRL